MDAMEVEVSSLADDFLNSLQAPTTAAPSSSSFYNSSSLPFTTDAAASTSQGAHHAPAANPSPKTSFSRVRRLRESLAKPFSARWSYAFEDPAPTELASWGAILAYIGWLEEHPLRAHVSDVMLVEWAATQQEGGVMEWVEWGAKAWSTGGALNNNPLLFLAHVMEAVRVAMADRALVSLAALSGWEKEDASLGDWLAENEDKCGKRPWRLWNGRGPIGPARGTPR